MLDEPAFLVRVCVLAVGPYHIDSAIEVHRIGAVAAVDGVLARVVVSVDHIVASTSTHHVDAALVGALLTGDRVVAPVTADVISAASSREVIVAAAASYLVGTGGAYEGVGPGRAMSARTFPKPGIKRTYLYYVCISGAHNRPDTCYPRKHHKAEMVETRVWDSVSRILKDPERLRAGLDHTVEQESRSVHGDPAAEMERWLEEISKAGRKRARYQEMAAEGLIELKELRAHLSALEDTRKTAEWELRALEQRTEHLAQLKRDRETVC